MGFSLRSFLTGGSERRARPARRGAVHGYAGAAHSRLTQDWYAQLLSSDAHIKRALRTLRGRSRQLVRDNPHAVSFVNLLKSNIVGPDGVRLQSQVRAPDGSLSNEAKALNHRIEESFGRWGEHGACTVDGGLSWVDVQDLAVETMAVDGEYLIRTHEGFDNEFGFALQFLDADQLDEQYNRSATTGANEIRMGVEVDGFGRPVAYWCWNGHPNDINVRAAGRVRVPASQILHGFRRQRPGQTRGVPWTTPVMFRLNMIDGYEEAEVVAARSGAAKPIYFETKDESADTSGDEDAPSGDAEDGTLDDSGRPLMRMEIEPGVAEQLPYGVVPHQMDPTHPTTAYPAFIKAQLRAVAAGLGVSYNALANDLESVSYSSLRGGALQERDLYRKGHRLLTEQLNRPVFRRWLPMAALTGAVQLPTSEARKWAKDIWQPRGWTWVDPESDIAAEEAGIGLGVRTRRAICSERGVDFEEVLQQLAEEERMAEEYGVDISGSKSQAPRPTTAERFKNGGKSGGARPKPGDDTDEDEDNEERGQGGSRRRRTPQLMAVSG